MTAWRTHLFRTHSQAELETWARTLSSFRFCGAIGGHANDGEGLLAALRYTSPDDFGVLARTLGLHLQRVPWIRWKRIHDGIPDAPRWKQPLHQRLGGVPVFLHAQRGSLTVHIAGAAGNPYTVTTEDVERARAVESLLVPVRDRIVDPPRDSELCLCPKYYPEIFR